MTILENLKGLRFGIAKVMVTKIAEQHGVKDPGGSVSTRTNVLQNEKKELTYIGFKRNDEMVYGIPLTTAFSLSAVAALGIAAWQYFT